MLKIDLHTHSNHSPDGGISQDQYAHIFENGILDFVAVTDHNSIAQAQKLHKLFGDRIIVGSEIMSRDGEIIGLFLSENIRSGQSAKATIDAIHAQGALVYLPHPLETVHKGVSMQTMEVCKQDIDIVEAFNGRAVFQNRGPETTVWARLNRKPMAASSDAHSMKGVGTAFTMISQKPTAKNLAGQLRTARRSTRRPPLLSLLSPKINRLVQKMSKD